jgi:RHS repeat-associated protein
VVSEESSAGQWNRGEVYAGGQHLVTYNHKVTYFIAADALGTERIRSTLDHTSYESCMNLPFGDGLTCTGTAVGEVSPLHFTGKERDAEDTVSGNDYFGARFYASNFGRFMSPDPSGGHLMNPQSLNRYAYVHNSPLNMIDPTGLDCVYLNGGGTSTETVLRGDCISDTDNGVFVAGRVDVGEGAILNSGTDTLSFAYTPSGTNSSVTYNGEAPDPTAASYFSPNFNSDVPLNPFAQGVSSQLNAMPIAKFVGTVYAASVVTGVAAGASAPHLVGVARTSASIGEQIALDPKNLQLVGDFLANYSPGPIPATLGGLSGFIVSNWDNLVQASQEIKDSIPH